MKKLLPLLLFLILGSSAISQIGAYNFSVKQEAYQNLTGSTSLNQNIIWDDPTYSFSIPFNIEFLGKTYNTLEFGGLGGFIQLMNSTDDGAILIPYGSDIIDRGYISGNSTSNISHLTTGTAGNRILKIEWRNVGFYNEYDIYNSLTDSMNFQLWIYEDGAFEYRYGPSKITLGFNPHEASPGPLVGVIDSFDFFAEEFNLLYYLKGSPSNPTLDSVNMASFFNLQNFLNSDPQNGTVYRFAKANVGVKENKNDLFVDFYPTIANNNINVDWNLNGVNTANLTIYDVSGKLMTSENISTGRSSVNIQTFSSGTYFLILKAGDIYRTGKFVKE